jgi:hypothetical protein
MGISAAVVWLLLSNEKAPTMNEVSTIITSMTCIGFQTSFWLRLRAAVNAHYGVAGGCWFTPGAVVMWSVHDCLLVLSSISTACEIW